MATTATTKALGTAKTGRASFFDAIAKGFNAYLERQSRTAEIKRLNAMTDEQLASLGISRDRIAQYVFRDMFYV